MKIGSVVELKHGVEAHDTRFPLLKFTRASSGDEITYKYIEKVISNKVKLVEDKKIIVSGKTVEDRSLLIENWIDAYYDGDDIRLYDKAGNRFCVVPWETYDQREQGYCEEGTLFALKLINDKTYNHEWQWSELIRNSEEEDYAIVQLQYDPAAEHDCCKECKTCIQTEDSQIACISCKGCEMNSVVLGLDECRKKTDTPPETPATPACCLNCGTCTIDECGKCTGQCKVEGNNCVNI